MTVDESVRHAFSPTGPLASSFPGFRSRPQQLEMALAIARTIDKRGEVVLEAGTGTGKTLAYLVPALLAGGKVIVSTATRTLQDQLVKRDLPAVISAMGFGAVVALLKGRGNYICRDRLARAKEDDRARSRAESGLLRRIDRFAAISSSGDRGELPDIADDSPIWPQVTSTRENCLGQNCPEFKDCFVMRARRDALAADVVVVNHHLYFADVALRDEGLGELLPSCNTVIFDEAHQIPETARMFFGERTSTAQAVELCADARLAFVALKEPHAADAELRAVDAAARELRIAAEGLPARASWEEARRRPGLADRLADLRRTLAVLATALEGHAPRAEGVASCLARTRALGAALETFESVGDERFVRWVDVSRQAVRFQRTPLSIAEPFRRQMADHPRAWVFTSATLAVGGEFTHFTKALGLESPTREIWASPFLFEENALLYLPSGLPEDPNREDYADAVVEAVWPVLEESAGRAFLLFTSLRALRRAAEVVESKCRAGKAGFTVLVQGRGSRTELLQRFRTSSRPILLGSQTFWEGVDVRGEALSVVVVDKLPFAPPDDPVLKAQMNASREEGGNPFVDIQLPQAILQLKQGVGRLIRDEADRGVLVLCDPRLHSRGYGRLVLGSLPPMRRTRDPGVVKSFFSAAPRQSVSAAPPTVVQ